jgi:hypothetical protein
MSELLPQFEGNSFRGADVPAFVENFGDAGMEGADALIVLVIERVAGDSEDLVVVQVPVDGLLVRVVL